MISELLEKAFPGLRSTDYRIASPIDPRYNCIAWAANDSEKSWWPWGDYYWPPDAPFEETLDSFQEVFESLGYAICQAIEHEPGFEKVAIYVDDQGAPTHGARQLESGIWTSKLGAWQDIEHDSLDGLEGHAPAYGTVALVLRRLLP